MLLSRLVMEGGRTGLDREWSTRILIGWNTLMSQTLWLVEITTLCVMWQLCRKKNVVLWLLATYKKRFFKWPFFMKYTIKQNIKITILWLVILYKWSENKRSKTKSNTCNLTIQNKNIKRFFERDSHLIH